LISRTLRILGALFIPLLNGVGKLLCIPLRSNSDFILIKPSKRALLLDEGVEKACDLFNKEGVRVTGHGWKTGRHVSRISLGNGSASTESFGFLKKEYAPSWIKSFFVQSSGVLHEARILKALELEGIPAPLWLAVGKTSKGESFLLVDEIPDTVNLKTYLTEQRSRIQRKEVLRRLAWILARIHTLGFSHVDLYSKHILINPETRQVFLLDWQRSFRLSDLPWHNRAGNLARLHATLDEAILQPREKLAFLASYLEATAQFGQGKMILPMFHLLALDIDREAIRLLKYRHIREKRNTQTTLQPQNWIFLEDKNLFVTSICSESEKACLETMLEEAGKSKSNGKIILRKSLPLGGGNLRLQYRKISWFESFLHSGFKFKKSKSPEYSHAAILFRVQRHGVETGKLLALGIRKKNLLLQESFLLTREPCETQTLNEWLMQGNKAKPTSDSFEKRRQVFQELGKILAKIHTSGCHLKGKKTLQVRVPDSSNAAIFLDAANCLQEASFANPKWASIDLNKMKQLLLSLGALQKDIVHYRKAYSNEISNGSLNLGTTTQSSTGLLAMDAISGGVKLKIIRDAGVTALNANKTEIVESEILIQVQKDGTHCKFYSTPDWVSHYGADWIFQVMDIPVTDRFHAKQGRSVGRIIIQGKEGKPELAVYLKRHYELSWWEGMLSRFFPKKAWSPAMQEFHHLASARLLGLQVPDTLAAVEFIGPGNKLRSALAVRELENMLPLHEAIPLASSRMVPKVFKLWKKSLVAEMARMARMLHDRNWFHKDLYLCHFYIHKNDTFRIPEWRDNVVLIDLHRLGSHPWTAQVWKIKDLAQLIYSSEIEGVDDKDRIEFWRCYRDLGPRSFLDRILLWVIKLKWARYKNHNLKKKAA